MAAVEPLIAPLVRLLARLRLNPLVIVAAHAACAALAAVLITLGPRWWPWAAGLLLLRMLLDNIDGAVARSSGQVTLAGRYFDTGMDLLTNLALFVALATLQSPLLTGLAFLVLTFLLSLDYNLERLYLAQRQVSRPEVPPAPSPGPRWILKPFRALYGLVLAPQDRFITWLEQERFRRLAGRQFSSAPLDQRLAWSDLFSTASLVNLGLSTQTILLALLLAAGFPELYPVLVLFQGALVLLVQLWRGWRFRSYLQLAVNGAS